MKLHIFNPEHDMALAHNDGIFTPPHAVRELRADLGFLPSLWADDGDMVLVDDVGSAIERVRHVKGLAHDVVFVTANDIPALFAGAGKREKPFDIVPWGWDKSLRYGLEGAGVPSSCMPSDGELGVIRTMSGRGWANVLRSRLPVYGQGVISMPREHYSIEDFLECYAKIYDRHAVVKAPWSSSGRGIRYFRGEIGTQGLGWLNNVIRRQGYVVSEAYFDKVRDFAVEFYAHEDGSITCEGLSLFKTVNGAYAGNILATEDSKWEMLAKYDAARDLPETIELIMQVLRPCLEGKYSGPFGVDMMILAGGILHPCVELNLRRTMGHVALAASPAAPAPQRLMRIDHGDRYHLRIINTFENVIDNSLIWRT